MYFFHIALVINSLIQTWLHIQKWNSIHIMLSAFLVLLTKKHATRQVCIIYLLFLDADVCVLMFGTHLVPCFLHSAQFEPQTDSSINYITVVIGESLILYVF